MLALSYDFIVVGGGSSGALLARELASKGPTLLIDRGYNHSMFPQSAVPEGAPGRPPPPHGCPLLHLTFSRPLPLPPALRACCRGETLPPPAPSRPSSDRAAHLPLCAGWPQIAVIGWDPVRAADSGHWLGVSKLFGGGSSINGGVLWRAEASVFEPLGFGADEVGAAFETIQAEFSEPAPRTEYASVFADAWQKLGYPAVPSAGAASWAQPAVGVHTARTMFVGGTRRTAAHPLHERPNANLTVLLHARVERVLFKARRAYAVEARVESVGRMTLRVRRGGEVLLACGAIETPKLLMLSGVGPADTLRRFDIPLVAASEGVGVRARTRRNHRPGPFPPLPHRHPLPPLDAAGQSDRPQGDHSGRAHARPRVTRRHEHHPWCRYYSGRRVGERARHTYNVLG